MMQFQDLLRQDAWFSGLPQQARMALSEGIRLRKLGEGESLFNKGEPFAGIYCLIDGSVRVGCINAAGSSAILALIDSPQWFGEVGLFDRKVRSHDAIAERPTLLMHLPEAAIDAALEAHPILWKHFGALVVDKMRNMFIGLEAYTLRSSHAWVARRILMIAEQNGLTPGSGSPSSNVIPVSQDQLAQMVVKSRQHTNTLLRKLEVEGILRCGYRSIEILDWDGLSMAAELPGH